MSGNVPRSVCPVCLTPIPATHENVDGNTYLVKSCPDHGTFRTVVWRGEPGFGSWSRPKVPSMPRKPFVRAEKGCPFDCGLCDAHRQHTCTAVLEVTWRCDLRCPICFAGSGKETQNGNGDVHRESAKPQDPTLSELSHLLDRVLEASGPCNLQLSGGEPTMRDDLPEVVRLAKSKGFPFVQVNTNGLRLGREDGYAEELARAGLDSAFLQFDGTVNGAYTALRGRPLFEHKLRTLDRLALSGIGVVLVPTVVPGVNDHLLGDIIRLAAERSPAVRGVHFQPVSYFGRYPESPSDHRRITLPEIMRLLEAQTGGGIRASDFLPPGCEHSLCSFHANYVVREGGELQRLSASTSCGCTPKNGDPQGASGERSLPRPASEGADKAKAFVRRQWAAPTLKLDQDKAPDRDRSPDSTMAGGRSKTPDRQGMEAPFAMQPRAECCCDGPSALAAALNEDVSGNTVEASGNAAVTALGRTAGATSEVGFVQEAETFLPGQTDELDAFIRRAATHTLAVSAMAFQDAWTLDFERLKGCCIHVVSPTGHLIPFCAYNLTSMTGETLYRGKHDET